MNSIHQEPPEQHNLSHWLTTLQQCVNSIKKTMSQSTQIFPFNYRHHFTRNQSSQFNVKFLPKNKQPKTNKISCPDHNRKRLYLTFSAIT